MRADFFVAIALAAGALTCSIPVSLAPVLFPHISRAALTTVFYSALILTALLFVSALYLALGHEPSRVIRSSKMLALACMVVCALGLTVRHETRELIRQMSTANPLAAQSFLNDLGEARFADAGTTLAEFGLPPPSQEQVDLLVVASTSGCTSLTEIPW
jgi:hypothetical protein